MNVTKCLITTINPGAHNPDRPIYARIRLQAAFDLSVVWIWCLSQKNVRHNVLNRDHGYTIS